MGRKWGAGWVRGGEVRVEGRRERAGEGRRARPALTAALRPALSHLRRPNRALPRPPSVGSARAGRYKNDRGHCPAPYSSARRTRYLARTRRPAPTTHSQPILGLPKDSAPEDTARPRK